MTRERNIKQTSEFVQQVEDIINCDPCKSMKVIVKQFKVSDSIIKCLVQALHEKRAADA